MDGATVRPYQICLAGFGCYRCFKRTQITGLVRPPLVCSVRKM